MSDFLDYCCSSLAIFDHRSGILKKVPDTRFSPSPKIFEKTIHPLPASKKTHPLPPQKNPFHEIERSSSNMKKSYYNLNTGNFVRRNSRLSHAEDYATLLGKR